MTSTNLKVGDEVVVFYCGSPLEHAGMVQHPCRGKVLKIGRSLVHVSSNGAPIKCRTDGSGLFAAHCITKAKRLYAASFDRPNQYRTPEQIAQYVASL